MIIYKFYLRDSAKGDIFLGSLPERRKNPKRVSEGSPEESVLNWGRTYFGKHAKEDIYFIKTVLDERENQCP